MLSDFKYGLRQMRKNPGFTLIAVLILGLGIGVSTSVFTLVDAVLLRGLPVRDPGQLAQATVIRKSEGRTYITDNFSLPTYELFRDHARSFSGVIAVTSNSFSLVASGLGQNNAVPVAAGNVSGNFFSVLGVQAFSGRTLAPADDKKGAPNAVAVLSYAFWQRNFGADPGVIGKAIRLDNVSFVIVGIAQPGFFGVKPGAADDLWMPIQTLALLRPATASYLRDPRGDICKVLGRLQPGEKREAANSELEVMYRGQGDDLGIRASRRPEYWGNLKLVPGGSGRPSFRGLDDRGGGGGITQLLHALMAVVGLALIITCANVGGLLLARTAVRQREFAVRAALGAARGRIIRQLTAEGLLLSVAGGLLGLLAAYWFTHALGSYFSGQADSSIDLRPDSLVVIFAIAVSAIAGIFVGLIPALRFSQVDLVSAIKSQAGTTTAGSRQRLNKALVVGQIAVSVCLLVGAGLLIRSLQGLKKVDPGFNRENLLLVTVDFHNYDAGHKIKLAKEFLAGFAALPGVRTVTLSSGGLSSVDWTRSLQTSISVDGYVPKPGEVMDAYVGSVGPRYFENMGIPLKQGRDFSFADIFPASGAAGALTPVVINEAMAQKYFGNANPIGRGLKPYVVGKSVIIGVARNTKYANLRDDGQLVVFAPYPAASSMGQPGRLMSDRTLTLALRTAGNPGTVTQGIYAEIKRIDPAVYVSDLLTMEGILDRSVFQERIIAQVSGFCSVFALILACLGLYGLLSYNVAQRTREIGVRVALGARSGNIVSLVVGQAMGLALAGCAIGLAGGVVLTHIIASKLYGVASTDPLTFLFTVAVLLGVALLACWLPARRATKVDPMIALRAE